MSDDMTISKESQQKMKTELLDLKDNIKDLKIQCDEVIRVINYALTVIAKTRNVDLLDQPVVDVTCQLNLLQEMTTLEFESAGEL